VPLRVTGIEMMSGALSCMGIWLSCNYSTEGKVSILHKLHLRSFANGANGPTMLACRQVGFGYGAVAVGGLGCASTPHSGRSNRL